jgi:hypothetical protein
MPTRVLILAATSYTMVGQQLIKQPQTEVKSAPLKRPQELSVLVSAHPETLATPSMVHRSSDQAASKMSQASVCGLD